MLNEMDLHNFNLFWVVFVLFSLIFWVCLNIGSRDTLKSFQDLVDSKVVSKLQIYVLVGVFEVAGAFLLGTSVSTFGDRIHHGNFYVHGQEELVLGGSACIISKCRSFVFLFRVLR